MSFFLIQNSFLEWAYFIDNSYFSFFPTPIILNDSRIGLGSRSFLYFEVSFFVEGALSAWHSASSFIWKTGSLVKRRDFCDWEEAGCVGPDWFLSLGKHVSCLDPHAVRYQGPHSRAGVCSDPFCLCPCGQVSFIVVFIIRKPTYPPSLQSVIKMIFWSPSAFGSELRWGRAAIFIVPQWIPLNDNYCLFGTLLQKIIF